MYLMIRTIGELKKAIANIDDDFTTDVRIVRELSEEELSGSNYPYPYEYIKANLEIGDIGYSDKDVFINIEEISDDVCEEVCCEWKHFSGDKSPYRPSCKEYMKSKFEAFKIGDYCTFCGKKIKIVGD